MTRARIVEAAIELAEKKGIEALSMRALAKSLGFGVMSIYNHVSNKDDLLGEVVDAVTSEIQFQNDRIIEESWKEELRSGMISAYGVLSNHKWLPGVWNRYPGPAKHRFHEWILRTMRESGFSEELACRGFHALTMHLGGFALQATELPFSTREEFVALCNRFLQELDEKDFHYVREHIQFHLEGKDRSSDFAYMLDLILDGLERDLTTEG